MMRLLKNILLLTMLYSATILAQHDRKVLVEIFTNSHCPHCPSAHNIIDNYLAGLNGDKISYIYYHMVYPYSDDQLYIESKEGSDARDNYYDPVSFTPQGWFDGMHQGSSSGWSAVLDNLVLTESPLKIILSGTRNTSQFNINAELTRSGSISDNDLVIHFIVAENLYYNGRNGIFKHKHVMRRMLPTPDGQSFSIDMNETKDIPQTIDLEPLWDADSLSVVVFVQSTGSKTVYQSETISYSDLTVTSVRNDDQLPDIFVLEQNYPNPFNPSTKIKFTISQSPLPGGDGRGGVVTLKVYDILGNEVATLVNEELPPGEHEAEFFVGQESFPVQPSGVYFYQLRAGEFFQTKKMTLIK